MTPLQRATLAYHASMLNSPDAMTRLRAGAAVCECAGVAEIVRAISPDGVLNPPPEWPAVDVVPTRCESPPQVLIVAVRTRYVGVTLSEEWKVDMPVKDGALMDAVERGKWVLARRIDGMVMA